MKNRFYKIDDETRDALKTAIMLILHGFYYLKNENKSGGWIDLDKVSFVDMVMANFDEDEIKSLSTFVQGLELDEDDTKFVNYLEKLLEKEEAKNKKEQKEKEILKVSTITENNITFVDFSSLKRKENKEE